MAQQFEIQGRDFNHAGNISTTIKEILQETGIPPSIIIRTAIATYEAEMNVVMYADKGTLYFSLAPDSIRIKIDDRGTGIKNISLAMKEGYSTATNEYREMGFGAGMGLPNIKKNADKFKISSCPGKGTTLEILFFLNNSEGQ
ncbi:MAG: anti-sigma regulatory factor [Candidatus Aminicenantes bacterium]|nr:anti-sigma regulatory factor [Candidatus Aminicenantes bacterium]